MQSSPICGTVDIVAQRQRIRKGGKLVYTEAAVYDPSPLYACEVVPVKDAAGNTVAKIVFSWMAFDPQHGPDTEKQIDWHVSHGTPGAETWEVGKACS